jgi:hypothetical protein
MNLTKYADEEARPAAGKVLTRWRPHVVQAQKAQEPPQPPINNTNGVQTAT